MASILARTCGEICGHRIHVSDSINNIYSSYTNISAPQSISVTESAFLVPSRVPVSPVTDLHLPASSHFRHILYLVRSILSRLPINRQYIPPPWPRNLRQGPPSPLPPPRRPPPPPPPPHLRADEEEAARAARGTLAPIPTPLTPSTPAKILAPDVTDDPDPDPDPEPGPTPLWTQRGLFSPPATAAAVAMGMGMAMVEV